MPEMPSQAAYAIKATRAANDSTAARTASAARAAWSVSTGLLGIPELQNGQKG